MSNKTRLWHLAVSARTIFLAMLVCGSVDLFAQDATTVPSYHVKLTRGSYVNFQLDTQLSAYFGSARGDYIGTGNTYIYGQFKTVLTSLKDTKIALYDGDYIVASPLKHQRSLRTAVILDSKGNLKGAALLRPNCNPRSNSNDPACSDITKMKLVIFLKSYPGKQNLPAETKTTIARLRKWGMSNSLSIGYENAYANHQDQHKIKLPVLVVQVADLSSMGA